MLLNGRRWIEASEVIPVFPGFVWNVQIESGLREAQRKAILAAIAEMTDRLPALAPGEGCQSGQALHQREDFRDLVECIDDGVAPILRFLRISDEQLEITACWATVLGHGAANKVHSHPNNYLSGVCCVGTHAGADTINFHDPRPQTGVIRPPVFELTAENTDRLVIKMHDDTC